MCVVIYSATHIFLISYEKGSDKLYMLRSHLYEKDQYSSQDILFLFNKEIIEYDMKDAGFSIIKEFGQLPDYIIEKLEKLPKDMRKKQIGNIQRDDKEFTEIHKEGFKKAREAFFFENDLEDIDIISIKKDAIFVTKECKKQKVGKYINFRQKNKYSSYIRINMKYHLEFFYNINQLDVKGVSDEKLSLHDNYMLEFIRSFMRKMETSSDENVIEWLKRFIDKYKRKELEVGYYRELNPTSRYRSIQGDTFEEWLEDDLQELDIHWNFTNIILNLIQIPL